MLLQLNPPIPLRTPKGPGQAHLVIDYGPEHDLVWVVIIDDPAHAGEVWSYGNRLVRGLANVTLGRPAADPVQHIASMMMKLARSDEKAEQRRQVGEKEMLVLHQHEPGPLIHAVECMDGCGQVLMTNQPGAELRCSGCASRLHHLMHVGPGHDAVSTDSAA
jgi:hypothetical protein